MRTSPRVGAVTAAAALAAATVLASAGIATAQHTSNFTSSSTLSMYRGQDNLIHPGYDNRSGRDLDCAIIVSNNSVVTAVDRYTRSAPDPTFAFARVDQWPDEVRVAAEDAISAGEFNVGRTRVRPGHNGRVYFVDGTNYSLNRTFEVQGLSICREISDSSDLYVEVERTSGGGVAGSVENLFGSAS